MPFHRLLKYINIAIGIVLAAALGVVYWFAWRPLPQTSGTVQAEVAHPVRIARDALGVPHILANSIEDALFAQGYATAQDRLWQMEGLRRLPAGELSEIAGPAALESDREARNLRLRRLAEDAQATIPASDRAMLAAYARGVNAFIETHRDQLPLEFTLLGYQPRLWRVTDSLLIGFHMFRTLTTTWKEELLKRTLMAGGDPDKVDALFPVRTGAEVQPGSNAWVLAGKHTASGRPILANDMHLEWSIPGVWYMAHLRAPGLDVSGVSLPGVPGIIVGHNDRIAWGITNLQYDVQDLYIERDAEVRGEPETILVKGLSPVQTIVPIGKHGPLLLAQTGERISLRWTAADPGIFQFPFLDLNRARNWQDFRGVLARYPGPGSNFVYADVDGNIGYQVTGKLPIRNGRRGDLPAPAASADDDWKGYIPFEELPSAFNPPSGMIVTANQNPFPPDYRYPVHGNFATHYRSTQILQRLMSRGGWRPEEMLTIQKDVYSAFGQYLAGALVAACERRRATNPILTDAIALLRAWNGQMEKDLPQPVVVTLAFQHVRKALAERASPGKGPLYEVQMAPAVIESLLRTRPGGWFADYDEMLVRAFVDAIEEGRRIQGDDIRKWRYGRYTEFRIVHPVGGAVPIIGRYFNLGPVQMSGSSTTVKQTTRRLGPSMRMVADLSDWDKSLLNLPIGQSGQILSRHYKDQWEAFYVGRGLPMPFLRVDAGSILNLTPAR